MPEVKISSRLVIVGESSEDGVEVGSPEEGETELEKDLESRVWSGTVTTIVRASAEEQQRSLKWLVVVGSILAGLLLLALLCALLWAVSIAPSVLCMLDFLFLFLVLLFDEIKR